MSVLPSCAVILIGIGGFQPVGEQLRDVGLLEREHGAIRSASRSTTTGGASGFEYVSTR